MISLDVDESEVFMNDNIVRTGTIGDGSCFFHAILKAVYSDYSKETENGKKSMVKKLRKSISEAITPDVYTSLSGGQIYRLQTEMIFYDLFSKILDSSSIEDGYLGMDERFFRILRGNLTPEKLSTFKGSSFSSDSLDKSLTNLRTILCSYIRPDMSRSITLFLSNLYRKSFKLAYTGYKRSIEDDTFWADDTIFHTVTSHLGINVYFITEQGKLYPFSVPSEDTMKKSVILLALDSGHFEILGYKTRNGIKRLFDSEDISRILNN